MLNRLSMGLLAFGVAFSFGCRKAEEAKVNRAAAPAGDSEARVVRIATAAERRVEQTLSANGRLAAWDQAALTIKVAGRLQEIPVDVGSVVKKGDLVGQIERRDWELKVAQSRAAVSAARARLGLPLEGTDDTIDLKESSLVKEAKAELGERLKNRDRILKLQEQKILSESELETAEAAYEVALTKYEEALQETNNRKGVLAQRRAELNIAEQQLADTSLRAPFDGVIQERRASPGDYLMEGAPLATLVRVDPVRLRLETPERDAFALSRGQKVRFKVDGSTNLLSGQVDRLSPVIREDNRMLHVESDIANPNGRLRPGSFVRGEIVVNDNARAVMTPRSAVVTFAGVEKVFVAENGKAVERRITTGRVMGDEVEVVRGLKAGENVILEPGTMRNGQPVMISRDATEGAERGNERSSG